jgi:hypothetical protein
VVRRVGDGAELAVLVLDAVILAVLELAFLPLRIGGGWPFPVTALAAAVTVPLLVLRASHLSRHAFGTGAPLYAWVVVIVGLGVVSGPGGDVLLLGDCRALLLVGAGTIPGAIALGNALGRRTRETRSK